MTSPIERLPTELFDDISGQLGLADLIHLVQCSQRLHVRTEPALYASHAGLNRAMFWACKNGKLPTIRLATSYGANASVVNMPKRVNRWAPLRSPPGEVQVLTLHLAARNSHFDAFALLLELGAKIEDDVDAYQLRHLTRRLSVNKTLVDHLLRAGIGSQLRERHNLRISLVSIIQSKGSISAVRQLIDNGADAQQLQPLGTKALVTPLTAAIGVNSLPLVDFFIERGVDIHGENMAEACCPIQPLHIPVFAAARAMGKHGVEMMQRCLSLGAHINHHYYFQMTLRHGRIDKDLLANTPLLVYLDSIESWKAPMKLRPADGLAFLLEHSADIVFDTPSPVNFLLDKWGLEKLANSEFWAAISLLVENGASRFHTRRILRKYDGRKLCSINQSVLEDEVLQAWRSFVELVLKFREESVMIDELLVTFVREKTQFGSLERCTLDCFLRAGANINVMFDRTILDDLACSATYETSRIGMRTPLRVILSIFEFLIDRVADPTIVVKMHTAINLLREAMTRTRNFEGKE
ncbi:hypothetical protein N431DRAFT_244388 [Stipitochalara longipes BDJ]|nr:hypothetical protein N431DRAFT_244388 [Stipitochalara longipes BDJ]